MDRPAMSEMLRYIDDRPFNQYTIIFDDLKRFARDVQFHIKLRIALKARNVIPKCLNFNFEDTPEGEYVETILAAGAELERKQNRRQVIQKQKARLESGYWPFYPPPGYTQKRTAEHGKLLVPDEKADAIKEALEGFASDRFRDQADVRKYLESRNIKNGKPVYFEYVKRLLSRSIYAGFIEYLPWEVSRRIGHHQAIIGVETYEKVQEKLGGKKYKRCVEREDFPLRGLVVCSECGRMFTAAWSKGRKNKYPYYRCQRIWCKSRDVRKETVEGEFIKTLKNLSPKKEAALLAERVIMDVWEKKVSELKHLIEASSKSVRGLEREKEDLVGKIVKMQSDSVLRALEARIEEVDRKIKDERESSSLKKIDGESYGTAAEVVLGMLKNPAFMWENGGYKGQRLITKLVFVGNPVYDRNLGYGTENLSVAVRLFELIQAQESHDVEVVGVEPASGEACIDRLQA